MISFAELDANLKVKRVIVVSEANNADENGNQDENVGIAFCKKLHGDDTIWKQGAGKRGRVDVGKFYHEDSDSFVPPSPYPSWTLVDGGWVPPVEMPSLTNEQGDLGYNYSWNEPLYQDNPESPDVWELFTPQILGITDEPSDTTVSIGSSATIGVGVTVNYGDIEFALAEKNIIDPNDPEMVYWEPWDVGELFLEENSVSTGILTTSDLSGDYRIKYYGTLGANPVTTNSFKLTVN